MDINPFLQIDNTDTGGAAAHQTVIDAADAAKISIIIRHWPNIVVTNGGKTAVEGGDDQGRAA